MGVMARGAREIAIDGLASGGRGVGRADGVVWFVAGALPGDRVLAQPVRVRPRFVEARRLRLLAPSPARRESPPCTLAGVCGGCPWIELDESEQRRWKREILRDALERIGRFRGIEPAALVAPERVLGYRERVELTLGRNAAGERALGFHALDPGGPLVDVPRCPVLADPGNRVLEVLREIVIPALADGMFDEVEPVRVLIRVSPVERAAVVAFRGGRHGLGDLRRIARALMARAPELAGVVRLSGAPGRRGGLEMETVAGTPALTQRLGGAVVQLPAGSFAQVHVELAAELTRLVADRVGEARERSVIDLYSGAGRHGLELAARGARVEAADADRSAVAAANEAAAAAGLARRFRATRADAAAFLAARAGGGGAPVDALVANPPRTGMERAVVDAIAALGPERVVVVSCDPATLARDLRRLVGAGYGLEEVVPLDLFPQTAHVEAVATLERESRSGALRGAGPRRPPRAVSRPCSAGWR